MTVAPGEPSAVRTLEGGGAELEAKATRSLEAEGCMCLSQCVKCKD